MASANRSRVESCSGGLELVQCPHYPIYRAYTRPRVVLTLIKSCKHACGGQNRTTRLKKKKKHMCIKTVIKKKGTFSTVCMCVYVILTILHCCHAA